MSSFPPSNPLLPSAFPQSQLIGHEDLLVYFRLHRDFNKFKKAETVSPGPKTFESEIIDLPGPSLFYHAPEGLASSTRSVRHFPHRDTSLAQFCSFGDLPPRVDLRPPNMKLFAFRPGPALDLCENTQKLHIERELMIKNAEFAIEREREKTKQQLKRKEENVMI